MAPLNETTCIFYARGACRHGNSCKFVHQRDTGTNNRLRPVISARSRSEIPNTTSNSIPMREAQRRTADSLPRSVDSRHTVPCKFFSQLRGCQKDYCPFLHVTECPQSISAKDERLELDEDNGLGNLSWTFSGASVKFDESGHVLELSLPTDYSAAYITGFPPGTTAEAVLDVLCKLGFVLDISQVRVLSHDVSSEVRATVKQKSPMFARNLSSILKGFHHALSATPIPIATKRTDGRKVYVSWHKATHNVWLNFGTGEIATRVAQKFNEGRYTCLGHHIKSSAAKLSPRYSKFAKNHVPWTITLTGVPRGATVAQIKRAITSGNDEPRHVEMGPLSYDLSDAEVSVQVRSQLESHGPLSDFQLASTTTSKRAKATAWFREESDARSARSLDDVRLPILGTGKLTVTQVSSVKVKVSTAIYAASKISIEKEQESWKALDLTLRIYPDPKQRFMLLKVEGNNAKHVKVARSTLDKILSGKVMTDGERVLWSTTFGLNGNAAKGLKFIETELNIVIVRDKLKRQLRFHGPVEKLQPAASRIVDLLRQETTLSYRIDLNSHDLSWAIRGGFKKIEQQLGKNVATLDVESRRITINGANEQLTLALRIMHDNNALKAETYLDAPSNPDEECPICFCEAENPIRTACGHNYCLECLEAYCKSSASYTKGVFQVKCQGTEGHCSTSFTLRELNDHVSSSTFEEILKASFGQYIQRRPESFRFCPTPECGFIYRCVTAQEAMLPGYICPNCSESVCTSCHAQHGDYTCAEYKDLASGGLEALAKLKKKLNIKDCPECSTPIEKVDGCNHMTCGGCSAHICWVCMSVFRRSDLCYEHMNKQHGGIGIGLVVD